MAAMVGNAQVLAERLQRLSSQEPRSEVQPAPEGQPCPNAAHSSVMALAAVIGRQPSRDQDD
jgi:hypothetical protein